MPDVFPAPIRSHSHTPTGDDWKRRQADAARRKPGLALHRGSVFIGFAPFGYHVAAEGDEIHHVLAPPSTTVGGVEVLDLRFTPDGLTLRGRLPHRPPDTRLILDFGYARAEVDLSNRTAWWHWIKPVLLQVWTWTDKLVRKGLSLLP